MRVVSFLAGVALCALSAPASASPGNAPVAAQPSPSLSTQIAQELYSREIFPAFQPNFATEMEKGFRASADGAKMERLFPGFSHEFAREAIPQIRSEILSSLPALYAKVAAVYDQQLTPEEEQQLLDFARSPAGHALRSAVGQSYDIQALTQSALKDGKITDETAEQQRELIGMGLRQKVSDADATEIKRFLKTSAGQKAAELDKRLRPMLLDFSNSLNTPAASRQMNAIALKVAREMARKRK
jgi:hypothetical protein